MAELKILLTTLMNSRPKRHYNLKEAAEMCGISQSTVRNLIGRGVVESVIIGGRKTITEEDLIKIQTQYKN